MAHWHQYMLSIRSLNFFSMIERLTFMVAVSSSSSWSNSLLRTVNFLIVSTRANCVLTLSTSPWTSSRTYVCSARLLYVVNAIPFS